MSDVLDVWVSDTYAGRLIRTDGAGVSFTYDDVYRGNADSPALSLSMPKARAVHPPQLVEPWIDNLLPDNDTLREGWAARFGERRATAFNLLRHMGIDCAGAVQIVPEGEAPQNASELLPVAISDVESAIRALRGDETAWTFGEHGGRYSLGGAQGKFALAKLEDGWALPTGRVPSTHIFKVGINHRDDSAIAEFVTMRAAELLGLRVTKTELLAFGDEVALVSERFDRVATSDGIARIHQEDLCQALGLSRQRKYEDEGGPGIAAIGQFLKTMIDPRDRAIARELFARSVCFNWLIAGTDAHAKNYAIVHLGSRVLLAPLYDLTSASLLDPPKEVFHKGKMAMKIGGEYRLGHIKGRHLERAAQDLGVKADWMLETVSGYVSEVCGVVERALDEVPALPTGVRETFMIGIKARARDASRGLN